jgi:hypothetical protein
MAGLIQINDTIATRIYVGQPNHAVLFVNQNAVDVYLDEEPSLLNSTMTGAVPAGGNATKLAATGGQVPFSTFTGEIWARAVSKTSIQQLSG